MNIAVTVQAGSCTIYRHGLNTDTRHLPHLFLSPLVMVSERMTKKKRGGGGTGKKAFAFLGKETIQNNSEILFFEPVLLIF